jgi:hypothetical protein
VGFGREEGDDAEDAVVVDVDEARPAPSADAMESTLR